MPEYRVIWEVEVTADDHVAAAEEARNMQLDPASLATVFDVEVCAECDPNQPNAGMMTRVDLNEIDAWRERIRKQKLMNNLVEYVRQHTERGECQCGRCIDKGPDREPTGHSVDVHFFWVQAKNDPKKEDFLRLLEAGYPDMGRLRGGPSFIEIGAAIGDQGDALKLIGLGELVGMWKVITPKVLGVMAEADANMLAGRGFVMAGGFK